MRRVSKYMKDIDYMFLRKFKRHAVNISPLNGEYHNITDCFTDAFRSTD